MLKGLTPSKVSVYTNSENLIRILIYETECLVKLGYEAKGV
jgi:hypothetical protein